jgi:hypothetical protein
MTNDIQNLDKWRSNKQSTIKNTNQLCNNKIITSIEQDIVLIFSSNQDIYLSRPLQRKEKLLETIWMAYNSSKNKQQIQPFYTNSIKFSHQIYTKKNYFLKQSQANIKWHYMDKLIFPPTIAYQLISILPKYIYNFKLDQRIK